MPEQLPETRFLDMAAKAADGAGWNECRAVGNTHTLQNSIIAHARTLAELAALKPVPEAFDPLQFLVGLEFEKGETHLRPAAQYHQAGINVREGSRNAIPHYDKIVAYGKGSENAENLRDSILAALAAFKSERPRYTPEQATEIAREICARVAEASGQFRQMSLYRAGFNDKRFEMTFTKAMLLHETGEGK